jgi:hypothetical protein
MIKFFFPPQKKKKKITEKNTLLVKKIKKKFTIVQTSLFDDSENSNLIDHAVLE